MKIYVDSRNRIAGSNEDFTWQIPESIDLPESLCYIDVVLVPNVFYSIKLNFNDKIRYKETVTENGVGVIYYQQAQLAPGQYNGISLAEQVQSALRSVTQFTPSEITVAYDLTQAKLKISLTNATGQINIFPDSLLTDGLGNWNDVANPQVDSSNNQSAGKVCGFLGDLTIPVTNNFDGVGDSVIDVQRHHVLYIHSDIASLGSSYGPQGQSDIIRRVIVDAPQNGLAIDRHSTAHDNVEVSSRTLRSMNFRLAGAQGETVDLRGHHWSFSLIFHEKI